MNRGSGRLVELHASGRFLVTAHRGLSASVPENTLAAFDAAVQCGADLVEFDVRMTRDGVPVVLHDATLDRTTDGSGPVSAWRLDELRELNASFWVGPARAGRRLDTPALRDARVPTLEETLAALAGRVALNIQVKVASPEACARIVDAFRHHALAGSAYLVVDDFAAARAFRAVDPGIELCVGEKRDDPQLHATFGLRLLQPGRSMVTEPYARQVGELGQWAHVFYANTPEDLAAFRRPGISGVLTDCADRMAAWVRGETSPGRPKA